MDNNLGNLLIQVKEESEELEQEFSVALNESASVVFDMEFRNIIEAVTNNEQKSCLSYSHL